MTDLEKLQVLLGEWKVPFAVTPPGADRCQEVIVGTPLGTISREALKWASFEGEEARVDGYGGFYTMFAFGPAGEFMVMGAWE